MKTYIFKNNNITLKINGDATVSAVVNAHSGEEYTLACAPLCFVADGEKQTLSRAVQVSEGENLVFTLENGTFRAVVTYSHTVGADFVEKAATICRIDGEPWTCDSAVLESVVPTGEKEIILHDDQSLWHVPTNFFIRYGVGGICLGLEYPYWDAVAEGGADAGKWEREVVLSYSPHYTVKSGEVFECEKTFFGTYRKENVARLSHGPYPDGKEREYYKDYSYGGLSQHFKDNVLPDDVGMMTEKLDIGEVYAMQDFFRHYLKKENLPERGWWLWQNGWWAGLTKPDKSAIDPLLRADVHDLMTFAIYYGHDTHPSTSPAYIREVRETPLGFPVMKDGEKKEIVNHGALHAEVEAGDGRDDVVGYTDEFKAPDEYDEFINYSREKGMYIASFSTPNNAYLEKPEWLCTAERGEAQKYFGTPVSCPACDEYMDFHFEVLCRVLDKYNSRFWAFDGRWFNYSELAGYGYGKIGPTCCYNPNHGHPVGDSRYKEWKNIQKFKHKLRLRYPNACLEQYYGLKRGGAWALTDLNADENYYEMGDVANNRAQTWHNENDRFRPTYLNYTSLVGTTPAEFEYSIISALSTSAYCQLSRAYNVLRDYPESAEILKGWKKWADENYDYLLRRRCLFGPPGENCVDASAHIIKDGGYIFVFSAPEGCGECEITLDRLIGLDEDSGAKYSVSEVKSVRCDGQETYCTLSAAAVLYGDSIKIETSPYTATLIKVTKI